MENMELLAKLTQTEKELQEQRKARDAEKLDDSMKNFDSGKLDELSAKLAELNQRLFLAKSKVTESIKAEYDKQVQKMKEAVLPTLATASDLKLPFSNQLHELKRLKFDQWIILAIRATSDDDLLFVNQERLSQAELEILKQYNPGYFNDEELPQDLFQRDQNTDKQEVPNDYMEAFLSQVKEIRSEQKELQRELVELRSQVEDDEELEKEKDL